MSALKFIQNSIKVLDTVLSEREKNRKNNKKKQTDWKGGNKTDSICTQHGCLCRNLKESIKRQKRKKSPKTNLELTKVSEYKFSVEKPFSFLHTKTEHAETKLNTI